MREREREREKLGGSDVDVEAARRSVAHISIA
jgi:hypothetical protein